MESSIIPFMRRFPESAYADVRMNKDEDMIAFEKLWKVAEEKGFSTGQLMEKCGLDRRTLRRLLSNENVEIQTLTRLCAVLECGLEDIAEYIPEEPAEPSADCDDP